MSSQITTAFVQQYKAEVQHLSQQQGSRLADKVRLVSQKGESAFYDRLGKATAVRKLVRHSDTPQIDSEHSRRRVTLVDYEWADLLDKEDVRRLLMDPAGEYAQAAVWALGRVKDDVLIAAANGSAWGGQSGSTEVTLPNAQKVHSVGGAALVDANVDWLRAIKKKFDAADVDENIRRYGAITSSQLSSLLDETQITSMDYNSIRALVMGQINTYLGFEFVRTEQLDQQVDALSFDTTTGAAGSGTSGIASRRCPFWAKDGLLLAVSDDIQVEIGPRPDKSYATQVYASLGLGATRMEEVKVVIGFAKES